MLTEQGINHCEVFVLYLKVASMFRMCSMQYFRPKCHTIVGALLEVLHVSHSVDNFLRLLAERIERSLLL